MRTTKPLIIAALASLCMAPAAADLSPDKMGVAQVPAEPGAHWIWYDDIAFFNVASGRAFLVDADTGTVLGMLSTGAMFTKLDLPEDYEEIYAVETYYSRGTRGERTDVVTIYDPRELSPVGEVIIPPKRHTGVPVNATSSLTDDDRFLVVYNMTPAQSVSVVDVEARKFVGEISTPGCALVYPAGARRFNMLCGDGSMLTVTLDDDGKEAGRVASEPFFDPQKDPVTEKAVRHGNTWLYVSFEGMVHPVDVSGDKPRFLPAWSLLSDGDRADSWRIGGLQHLAVHQKRGLLYSAMHQGEIDTHKDPGSEIWVYDIAAKKRVKRLPVEIPAMSLLVTQDDNPVLATIFIIEGALQIYDADSGEHLRTIAELGSTPTLLHSP